MESQKAVSSGVDRCIKIWDLSRGFCKHSIMCVSFHVHTYSPRGNALLYACIL